MVVVVQTAVGNYITSGGVILRILDLTDHLLGLFKLELGHRTSGKHRDICTSNTFTLFPITS